MRITNKIMQNNNLANINGNKVLQDKLSTQMSTQKKINKPSDDPVVAIRALRLRSNVTEATQYYSKNIPDANSWLEVTEGALKNTSAIITNMIGQCTKGSNGDLTSSDRGIVLEQLGALKDEVYSTADVDYAGRYVFAGYRTDTSISFSKASDLKYKITDQIDNTAIDETTYIKTTAEPTVGTFVDLTKMNTTNYNTIAVAENDVEAIKVHRIRLPYSSLSADQTPTLSHVTGKDASNQITTVKVVDDANIVTTHSYDIPTAYELASDNPDKAYYIPESGELILGENVYQKMMEYKDDASTATVNEGEIRVTFEKKDWKVGDLRPEHYYACKSEDSVGEQLEYNQTYLDGSDVEKQIIEYDVGFNQRIRVNTTADECFDPNIGRTIDDLISTMQDVQTLEKVTANLTSMLKAETDATKGATLQSRLDAANKALTLSKDKMQKMFESSITTMQGFLNQSSISITTCGTQSAKLELIENRMKNQKTTFETLKSTNEDADITEVAIQLKSAELTYEAALMATGKVTKTSLINFI